MSDLPKEFECKGLMFVERSTELAENFGLRAGLASVELIPASEIRPQPITWLWEGWLAAGKLHILGGAPGTGKTTLAMGIAAILSSGGMWADKSQAPRGKVVVWSAEDSPGDTLVPRLIQCGADLERISFIGNVYEPDGERFFDPGTDIPKLREELYRIGDVRLLIVDPIVSAVTGNDHKNSEVRRSLQPLVDLADEIECAVLGITHFSKNTSGRNPLERITGSLAFGALARVVWVTAKGDGVTDKRVLLRAKSNIGSDDGGYEYELSQTALSDHPGVSAASVVWGEPLDGSARAVLGSIESPESDSQRGALAEAEDFLLKFLGNDVVPYERIKLEADSLGIKIATLRRAKDSLRVRSEKLGMSQGWGWSLKPKALKSGEDSHEDVMSIFGNDEHLRRGEMSPAERDQIRDWLIRVGDEDAIEQIIARCEKDSVSREFFLKISHGDS